jgi:hypothetical protein
MSAHVDPAAGLVSLGDRTWPFDLDLATESITVTVEGGRRLRVRPLRWREKLSLARFAHLGAAFVERQLVRACLVDEGGATDGDAAEAVAALARWVNDPDGANPALPLEQALLAEVTLGVCRALGLRPDDLDGRTAAEVERLWQATPGQLAPAWAPEPAGRGDDDLTRIVIVPDPQPGAEAGGDDRHPLTGARPEPPALQPQPDPRRGGLPRGDAVPPSPAVPRAAGRSGSPAIGRFQVFGDRAASGLRKPPLLDGDTGRQPAGRLLPDPASAPDGDPVDPDGGTGELSVGAGRGPADSGGATASLGPAGVGETTPEPSPLAAPAAWPAQVARPEPVPLVASPRLSALAMPHAPGATGLPAASTDPPVAQEGWPPAVAGTAPSTRAEGLDAGPRRAATSTPFPGGRTAEVRSETLTAGRAVPTQPGPSAPPGRGPGRRMAAAALDRGWSSGRMAAAASSQPVGADTGLELAWDGGRRLSEIECDALFEELGERLEQAAAEMGVDLEG